MVSVLKGKFLENLPLDQYTTFRIGGRADLFFIPEDEEDLKQGLSYCFEKKIPWFILGNGSDLLISDDGIEGMVIHLGHSYFKRMTFEQNRVTVGAGVKTAVLLRDAVEKSLGGIEFLAAVPGTMGGALYMNAGTYLGEISSVVEEVRILDESLNAKWLSKDDLDYRYRHSLFQQKPWVIVEGKLKLLRVEKKTSQLKVQEILERRKKTQPLGVASAGSAFKNPSSCSAWKLIDDSGLRGFSMGDAAVSDIHANFVINKGSATAKDVLKLMRHIQETVLGKTGILLEPEIKLAGRWEENFLG
jgi:UDP-N-acetylmuramate dehydrogenase